MGSKRAKVPIQNQKKEINEQKTKIQKTQKNRNKSVVVIISFIFICRSLSKPPRKKTPKKPNSE
jgi:hypothetical protein